MSKIQVKYQHSKGSSVSTATKSYTGSTAKKMQTESAILADLQKKHKGRQIVIVEIKQS